MFELYVKFGKQYNQADIRLSDEPTLRRAKAAAIRRCADDHVSIVKIYKGSEFIDSISGEAVRSNRARAERMRTHENPMA